MADLLHLGEGVIRQADAVLRAVGGRGVLLRLPVPAAEGDDAEQLGLALPGFQDVELGPAAFHKSNSVTKLMVSSSAVRAVAGSLAYDSAEVLFETAAGVVIDGVLYEIVDTVGAQAMGQAYCYWLTLRAPVR